MDDCTRWYTGWYGFVRPTVKELPVIASVHIADHTAVASVRCYARPPFDRRQPGLRNAALTTVAPLSASRIPSLDPRRLALIAFWDDEAALERFEQDTPFGRELRGRGWQTRLAPVRGTGTFPGLDDDLPTDRHLDPDGPAAVLTIGKLRIPRAAAFVRAAAKAQGRALTAGGLVWGAGLARVPIVSSFTLWSSSDALRDYAYGAAHETAATTSHVAAMNEDHAAPFHHHGAFVRFRPYGWSGELTGANPLAAGALDDALAQS